MLQAMNTGHDGSMSTIHANTARDAIIRIENMVQMGNFGLPSKSIRQQIVGAVDLIVQVERQRDGGRRLIQVTEVCGLEGDVVILNDIFAFELTGEGHDGRLHGDVPRQPGTAGVQRPPRLFRAGPRLGHDAGGRRAVPAVTALLLAASVVLVAFSTAGLLLMRADRVNRRAARRLDGDRRAAPPRRCAAGTRARLTMSLPTATLAVKAKMLIGMDPHRRDPYPSRPALVLPLTLLPGYAAQWLMRGLLGSFAWLLLPLVAIAVARAVYRGNDAKRTQSLYRQFPDALATIVRAVRVGIPVTEALRAVAQDAAAPTASEFQRLYDQVGVGTPLEDGLRELAARNRLPEYRFFATALALQSQTGGGLTETLENLAEVIRKRLALQSRGYALAAEARTSAGVLTALPVFAGLALAVLNPDYIGALFEPGTGQTVFGVTAAWLGCGIYAMRLMIRRSLT